jgi:hypothetical protein
VHQHVAAPAAPATPAPVAATTVALRGTPTVAALSTPATGAPTPAAGGDPAPAPAAAPAPASSVVPSLVASTPRSEAPHAPALWLAIPPAVPASARVPTGRSSGDLIAIFLLLAAIALGPAVLARLLRSGRPVAAAQQRPAADLPPAAARRRRGSRSDPADAWCAPPRPPPRTPED